MMHPNTFLNTLWRNEVTNQIFVAMSFDGRFTERFEQVVKPAIEAEPIEGEQLTAFRVDNSATGDSILTEIASGIAHSRLVLADVSVIDEGRFTQKPIRNGNVMYEVGLALAARSPSDVLLIRDDNKQFLFDVSTITHIFIDFSDSAHAIRVLRRALADRLRESNLINDSRVAITIRTITTDEYRIGKFLANLPSDRAHDFRITQSKIISHPDERGINGLLRKGCIRSIGLTPDHAAVAYAITDFGRAVIIG